MHSNWTDALIYCELENTNHPDNMEQFLKIWVYIMWGKQMTYCFWKNHFLKLSLVLQTIPDTETEIRRIINFSHKKTNQVIMK
jgi:hypothetical protein